MKFETINNTLCRMVEPEPLRPESQFPCVVRLIQDDSPMGRYNQSYSEYRYGVRLGCCMLPIIATHIAKNGVVNDIEWDVNRYEVIGYPIADGSAEWALWQRQNKKSVITDTGVVMHYHYDDETCAALLRAYPTGWQLYEPQPEPEPKPEHPAINGYNRYDYIPVEGIRQPKPEPEIVAHKQHANCLVCGKVIEGLLDGHATVSIKRYSISSLYESTYSHYCGKCFLELGFDATERELRNRQQPIAEPVKEQFKVGDWAKYDIDSYLRVIETPGRDKTLCKTLSGVIVYPYTSCLTKASPSEVVIRIGCLEGTVAPGCSDTTIMIVPIGYDGMGEVAIIPVAMLDPDTRELVESLLKAQEEK